MSKKRRRITETRNPPVSIIIALYNADEYFEECLDSILAQTYSGPIEVSIYDDASTDNGRAVLDAWLRKTEQERSVSPPISSPRRQAVALNSDQQKSGLHPVTVVVSSGAENRGAAFARNAAVRQSSGAVLVIQDADDIMHPSRVELQVATLLAKEAEMRQGSGRERQAITQQNVDEADKASLVLVGSCFERRPVDATWHYAAWANSLSQNQLTSQQYRECTLIQPTWVLSRATFDRVGGYEEGQLAEDLRFFLRLLELGGKLVKVGSCGGDPVEDQGGARKEEIPPLLCYRHTGVSRSLAARTPRRLLAEVRIRSFERRVLDSHRWAHSRRQDGLEKKEPMPKSVPSSAASSCLSSKTNPLASTTSLPEHGQFVIWGAGRDGRQFLNGLQQRYRDRVACFVDVDESKIANSPYVNGGAPGSRPIEIRHWRETPRGLPIVLCVAMGRTNGLFEKNVRELAEERGLVETIDYWHFN